MPGTPDPHVVHVVLPGDIDDADAPSGGNGYDRRVCQGLAAAGWAVRELPVAGSWPRAGTADRTNLAEALAAVPDDRLVLLDGLVGCAAPDVVVPHARRLRLAVLLHLPLAQETGLDPDESAERDALERRTLAAVSAVIATSAATRRWLVDHHGLAPERVHVAVPGAQRAALGGGTEAGGHLLCVAAVTPRKGQDVLVEALATLTGRPWRCVCVGALDRAPAYAAHVGHLIERYDLGTRVRLAGPRTGADLDAEYGAADLVILPSHAETFGMVVTEALARGIPVVASAVGGVAEALGRSPDGTRPGILVPPGDPTALAGAVRGWLDDPELRRRLRTSARDRRDTLFGWEVTSRTLGDVLLRLRP